MFYPPFPEEDDNISVVSVIPTSESSSFLTHPTHPASTSSSATKSQTSPTTWTSSSGSDHSDKPSLDSLSTASHLWESSISKQEGSTSLETEDTSTLENDKNPAHLFSEINVATTESLQVLNASQFPDTATASSSYRIYLDSQTAQFEEASGLEPETVTAIFAEDVKVYPSIRDGNLSQITTEEDNLNTTLDDKVTISPVFEDENKVTSTLGDISSLEDKSIPTNSFTEDTTATPTVSPIEKTVSPTITGKPDTLLSLEEETYVAPTQEEAYQQGTTETGLIFEESTSPTTERELDILPTVVPNEENKVHETYENNTEIISSTEFAFTQTPEEEAPLATLTQKEELEMIPNPEEGTTISPTSQKGTNISPTSQERTNITLIPQEGTNISLTLPEGTNISVTPKEGTNISLTPEEGINISQTFKEGTNISPTTNTYPTHEGNISVYPTTEADSNMSSNHERDISIYTIIEDDSMMSSTHEGYTNIYSNVEDKSNTSPTNEGYTSMLPTIEDDTIFSSNNEGYTNIYPTIEDESNVSPTIIYPSIEDNNNKSATHGGFTNIYPTSEDNSNNSPTHGGYTNIYPTIKDNSNKSKTNERHIEANSDESIFHGGDTTTGIYSTLEESTNVFPILEGGTNISPTHEDHANTYPAIEEDNNISSALEEESDESSTYVSPTMDDNLRVSPVTSQKSSWALLTTTVGPQQHLNPLEYSRKTSPATSTTTHGSSSTRMKPSAATMRVTSSRITGTTHWSRGAWSPTTSTPKVYHSTTEPQKVTTFIPPVDQGLVDVEFSLTQQPTLHILPNERAVVGNTGTASGNVNATLISLTILYLLLSVMMH